MAAELPPHILGHRPVVIIAFAAAGEPGREVLDRDRAPSGLGGVVGTAHVRIPWTGTVVRLTVLMSLAIGRDHDLRLLSASTYGRSGSGAEVQGHPA